MSQPKTTTMNGIELGWPELMLPLMEGYNLLDPQNEAVKRRRTYVAHGGRGSAKSWSMARALLVQGIYDPLRVVCAREIMTTIKDSVHALVCDQIAGMNMGAYYSVTDNHIRSYIGGEITYAGLRGLDVVKIKSLEGADLLWVEEGQSVVRKSWKVIEPTIRAEDSEIWVSMNPELDTDETYVRYILDPPDDAWVQEINWRDNPFFSTTQNNVRLQDLKRLSKEEYDNVWEGVPRTSIEGAIYSKEMSDIVRGKRIRAVPYDPRLPVHTIWDLGWNDQTSIIFCQVLSSEVRIIDYAEGSFLRPDEWARILKSKPYSYASLNLPHDGDHETLAAAGKSMKDQLEGLMRMAVDIIPRPESVEIPIRAGRMMFPRTYINRDTIEVDDQGVTHGCARLVECLRRFARTVPANTGEPGTPAKTAYRHGADAFGYLGMVVDKLRNDAKPQAPKLPEVVPFDKAMGI